MLFVMRFTDHQDRQWVREEHLEAHIAWLGARQGCVLAAGSLRSAPAQNPIGALWIVEADSKAEAETIYMSDPFWINGLRQEVEVLHWSKAFPNQKVSI